MPEGQPVLTLVQPGAREALVAIPEGGITDLDEWQAQASIWSGGLEAAPAKLREVGPQADAASRTHDARFTLTGPAASAELGATVTISLTRSAGDAVATLPSTAVIFLDGIPVVWRVTPTGDRVEGLCCTNPMKDSSCESSVVAGGHEQTHTPGLQDQELARL